MARKVSEDDEEETPVANVAPTMDPIIEEENEGLTDHYSYNLFGIINSL